MVVKITENNEKNLDYYLKLISENTSKNFNKLDFLELQDYLLDLEENRDNLRKEVRNLKDVTEEIKKLNKELQYDLSDAQLDYQEIFEEYTKLLINNKQLNDKADKTDRQLEDYEETLSSLEKALTKKQETISQLTQENNYYMSTLDKLSALMQMIQENDVADFTGLKIGTNLKDTPYYRLISQSEYFDKDWYVRTYNLENTADPVEHYLRKGCQEEYNPSTKFSTKWYLTIKPEIRKTQINPLVDYLLNGINENKTPIPPYSKEIASNTQDSQEYRIIKELNLFEEEWFVNDYTLKDTNIVLDYIKEIHDLKSDSTIKDARLYKYLEKNTTIATQTKPEQLKLKDSIEYMIIRDSNYFDKKYYRKSYEIDEDTNPLEHFMEIGYKDYLNPNENFDIETFIKKHDIKTNEINPLLLYIYYNKQEDYHKEEEHNRKEHTMQFYKDYMLLENSPFFDRKYYQEHNPDVDEYDDSIEHFLDGGFEDLTPTSKYFNPKWYLQYNTDVERSGNNPLLHFIKFGYDENRYYRRDRYDLEELKEEYGVEFVDTYDFLYKSILFNERYYLEHNPEVVEKDLDPIIHYMLFGAKKGRDPGLYFSSSKYLERYDDVQKRGYNPLYHFLKTGKYESRNAYMATNDFDEVDTKYSKRRSKIIYSALHKKVSIIMPLYNAYEQTCECIRSILQYTTIDYELILVDDCSNDKNLNTLLERLSNSPYIKILRNKKKLGFVKCVNMAMEIAEGDVVILSNDTVVTPRWLSHLILSAYSKDEIATVTPLSNSSDLSIPLEDTTQKALNKKSSQLDKISSYDYMESPIGNAFCLYIKREAIEDVGLFDESFKYGYGADYDFCQQARKKGWTNIINDSVLVYHKNKSSSTEANTGKLQINDKKTLSSKHRNLEHDWNIFLNSVNTRNVLEKIQNTKFHKKPERILVVTDLENDMPNVQEDFYDLSLIYDMFVLTITSDELHLYKYVDLNFITITSHSLNHKWDSDVYLKAFFNMIVNAKIDLMYVKYVKDFYQPYLQPISSFIKLAPYLEIKTLYEATIPHKNFQELFEQELNPNNTLDDLIEKKSSDIDWKNNKIVVYTALTGSYDELNTPSVIDDDFDYICFTDNPNLKSEFWKIVQMEDLNLDEVRRARRYKILPHKYLKDYDYSIWIDANFDIIGDLKHYINRYSQENKLLAIKHDLRDCLYDEAESCIELEKDSQEKITKQINKYEKEKYPRHNGLVASGILFRNHNDKEVIKVMEDWYDEIINHSRRDQLSFNYACWKNQFKYEESPIFYFKNEYFQRLNHAIDKFRVLNYAQGQVNSILNAFDEKTTIVIPIYNAYQETTECIESVLKYTNIPYNLLLINDCSPDIRIKQLLDDYESKYEHIKVIHNTTNKGFVKNVNMGFEQTESDVVLLNSDTEVTPKWLQKLKAKAYSRHEIATVTPISNNAGAFSVPNIDERNEINPELGLISTANIIEKMDDLSEIYTPTANGFCMYIKREAIYAVGFFDTNFGRGYGEENDFSMRLSNKEWEHVVDTSTYIYHKGSVSFLDEKDELIMKNRMYLDKKHPTYKSKVNQFVNAIDYRKIRQRIGRTLESDDVKKFDKKRILYVIHEGTGGTLHTSIELMKHVDENMEVYLLTAGREEFKLFKYNKQELIMEKNSNVESDDEFKKHLHFMASWGIYKYSIKYPYDGGFERVYFNVLAKLKIDIVHIRHLIRHTFDLPKISKKLGIPVILSFHDFYYICPSHCLIDDKHNYCRGICTHYDENDEQCMVNAGLNVPMLKTFVQKWRKYVREMFTYCDAFVTTSQSAYELYTKFYPELKNRQFEIIEHGRDLKTPDKIKLPEFSEDEKIRILFPGHINYNKGGELIKQIKEVDTEDRLEFHYMGNIREDFQLEEVGTYHGYYKRSEYCKEVHSINPHFIGLLSIWPETYCHTLTESWSCGIPVITLDIGALGERVKRHGGGFFIENNPQEAYNKIIEISKNPNKYLEVAEQIPDIQFKSTRQMAEGYLRIYEKYMK
ncbi:MAG: glycosyltransferase [Methanosphaera sp.]|nr:glycosyltransferase [Methanosphaera sp.]